MPSLTERLRILVRRVWAPREVVVAVATERGTRYVRVRA